jgi:hypothetical protein
MPQLDALRRRRKRRTARAPSLLERLRAWLDGAGWQGWALAAQLAVIAVLAAQLLPRAPAPDYRALAMAPPPRPTCWWCSSPTPACRTCSA